MTTQARQSSLSSTRPWRTATLKLHGGQPLTRVRGGENEPWLLVETSDEYAGARRNPVRSQPESVLSGRTLDELG